MPDFHVPGISELDPVGNKQMAPVTEQQAFAGHVTTDLTKPSHWQERRDFVPSDGKKQQILESKGLIPRGREPKPPMKVHKTRGVDYLSYEEGQKLLKQKGSKIRKMAKEALQERADDLKRYRRAEQIVKGSTESQRAECQEGSRLFRAMQIVAAGPPITQEKALHEARDRVFRENS